MYRVSTSQTVANGLYSIQRNQSAINDLMTQISTGKKQNLDAADKIQAHDYTIDISNNTQYLLNNQRMEPQLREQEIALSGIYESMVQLKELSIEINNPAIFDKEIFQDKFNSLKSQIMDLVNSKDTLGNYIFSGSLGDTQPFNNLSTYQGDNQIRKINISKDVSIDINIPGSDIIGNDFNNFLTKLQTGIDTQIFDVTRLDEINKSLDNVAIGISKIGFTMNKMDNFKSYLTDLNIDKNNYADALTNADMADSIAKLTAAQNSYQAALKSYSVIQNLSLFDYI